MEDSRGNDYDITSYWEHMTAEYLGVSVPEIENLDYIEYLVYRRDAFIYSLNQTESGREYLDNAYRIQLTEPDRKRLRDQFGKEE